MKSRANNALLASTSAILVGLFACAMIIHSANLQAENSAQEFIELVQMGVGAEDNNDIALKIALGPKDGDIAKDVAKETGDAVKKAQEETAKAVDEEITKALAKGESAGKGKQILVVAVLS